MAQKGSMVWVVVLGVIIVGALFAMPSALEAGGEAWNDLWSDFWAPFGETSNATFSGSLGIGVLIKYKDGTEKEYKPNAQTIVPLTVRVDDKPISSLTFTLQALITYAGTLKTVSITGTFKSLTNDGVLIKEASISKNNLFTSGVWFDISECMVTAEEIEQKIAMGWGACNGQANITIDLAFESGMTDSRDGQGDTGVALNVQPDGITSMEIRMQSGAI